MVRMEPLPGTFMITSILGFMVTSVYTIYGRINPTWGFAMGLIFVLMFIASIVSMTPGPAHITRDPIHEMKSSLPKPRKR